MTSSEINEIPSDDSTDVMDLAFSTQLPASTLRNIVTYADAFELAKSIAQSVGKSAILHAEDIGDGFTALTSDQKKVLVGKPFIILAANLGHDEVTDRNYVTCKIVTENGEKYRFSDGSTGIFAQIMDTVREQGGFVPMLCGNGLSKSEYVAKNDKGENVNAVTYYIDTNTL